MSFCYRVYSACILLTTFNTALLSFSSKFFKSLDAIFMISGTLMALSIFFTHSCRQPSIVIEYIDTSQDIWYHLVSYRRLYGCRQVQMTRAMTVNAEVETSGSSQGQAKNNKMEPRPRPSYIVSDEPFPEVKDNVVLTCTNRVSPYHLPVIVASDTPWTTLSTRAH